MKPKLKLEDMCECNKTLPLRNKLRAINDLYALYSEFKKNPIPFIEHTDSINEVMASLLENFECYGQIVRNQLKHEVMLARYGGKVCCAGCKTEIAFPNESIEAELYSKLFPDKPEIGSLN